MSLPIAFYLTLKVPAGSLGLIAPMREFLGEIRLISRCQRQRIFGCREEVSLSNTLRNFFDTYNNSLKRRGLDITFKSGVLPGNCSMDINSDSFVGTITFWTPQSFEFQFNDCGSGNVLFLETVSLETTNELHEYLSDLIATLSNPPKQKQPPRLNSDHS